MRLYQINQEIINLINEETGEIVDIEMFENLSLARDEKLENVALWIKSLKAEVEAYKQEKASFDIKVKQAENKIASLEKLLSDNLQGQKFHTPKVDVGFRMSKSIEVEDMEKLPVAFIRTKVSKEADKTLIKDFLKDGGVLEGVKVLEKKNIQIK